MEQPSTNIEKKYFNTQYLAASVSKWWWKMNWILFNFFQIFIENFFFLFQYIVLLIGTVLGLCIGWPSPAILLLTSKDSPLPTGKISTEESSWIASLKSIGALIAFPIFGFIANKFGRKRPIVSLAIPAAVRQIS